MTTKIEKTVFGKPTETQTITNQTLTIPVPSLSDRRIVIFDQDFARTTYVRDEQQSGKVFGAQTGNPARHHTWDVLEELKLANGETVSIGPAWCRLTITRE